MEVIRGSGRSLTSKERTLVAMFMEAIRDLPSTDEILSHSLTGNEYDIEHRQRAAAMVYHTLVIHHRTKNRLRGVDVPDLLPCRSERVRGAR